MKGKFYFFLFFFVFLVSCRTVPSDQEPLGQEEILAYLRKPLESLVEKGEWELLIAKLEQIKQKYPKDYDFEDFYSQGVTNLKEERISLWNDKKFLEAIYTGESLITLGEGLSSPSQEEIIIAYINFLKEGSLGQAYAFYQYFSQKGYSLPSHIISLPSNSLSSNSSSWLQGTLTLIVDQGVRMQSGVGVPSRVLGSAFLIDPSGYALTNYHVISSEVDRDYKGYSRLYARLPEGKGERLKADVVGYNKDLDIALVKVYFPTKYYFNLWNSSQDFMRVGQSVYALGSPLGLEQTITSGILSAQNRTLLPIGNAFQLDAAVNQGNSGGPVVNTQGDILGMVFAGIPGFEGLNFAIPVSWLRLYLPFLYNKGPAESSWIGLAISESIKGLEVIQSVRGSSTEGILKSGDILISINGRSLNSIADYQNLILTSHSLMKIKWKRDDTYYESIIYPQKRPDNPLVEVFKRSTQEEFLSLVLGVYLEQGKKTAFYRQYRASRVYPNMIGDDLNIRDNDQIEFYKVKMDKGGESFILSFLIRRQVAGFLESPLGIQISTDYPYFI